MNALDRKLARELWGLKGQLFSIALVVACGVMTVVTMRGTYEALAAALSRYYQTHRFADVFVSLERAPEAVARRVAELPGVAAVQTRVTTVATLDVPGLDEPATGQFFSIPERPGPTLNDLHLVRGAGLSPERPDEILVSQSFAEANHLGPGDSLGALIEGRWRRLRIVGIALSPDFIGELAPGSIFPDDRRFAVVRMSRPVLAAVAGFEGSFNDLAVRLAPGASVPRIIAELDRLLAPYGGRGAYARTDHPSHAAITGELEQNRVTGTVVPAIFLGVAAFLLNLVLGRLVGTQRTEIGVLKAFGYSDLQLGRHYLRFALVPVALGALLGAGFGWWAGDGLTDLYSDFFRFPELGFRMRPELLALTITISGLAAGLGALGAVRRATGLPPAEAMRPEAPMRFRPGPLERLGLGALLSVGGRLIVRNIERRPGRSGASVLGVALAVALVVVGFAFFDSVNVMTDLQFGRIQREDLAVGFTTERSASVRHELAALAGVSRVELFRSVQARVSHRQQQRTVAMLGLSADAALRRVVDRTGRPLGIPPRGVLMTRTLAQLLGVRTGDEVRIELLQGERRRRVVQVAATVEELFGLNLYMDFEALHRLLGEGPAASGAFLSVSADRVEALNQQLKQLPAVASVQSPAALRRSFEQQISESLLVSVTFLLVLACVLTVGVVYNGARIALAERGRELASLRVLGFTQQEVGVLLLGEQGTLTALAIPGGWLLGVAIMLALAPALDSERFRIPVAVSANTFGIAAAVAAASAALAGLLMWRRLKRLDLIAVLKTRE